MSPAAAPRARAVIIVASSVKGRPQIPTVVVDIRDAAHRLDTGT